MRNIVSHQNTRIAALLLATLVCCQLPSTALAGQKETKRKTDPILKQNNVDHYGYYMFLGLGDYLGDSPLVRECWTRGFRLPRCPVAQKDYICTWDLNAWKKHIDKFRSVGANTLAVLFNGHFLAYPSEKYPDLLEKNHIYVLRNKQNQHPNVKADFFNDVITYANQNGINMIAALCTTGHALGFTTANPDAAIKDREGKPVVYSGIACHRHPKAKQYAKDVIREVLSRYKGFWGIIIHPPEFTQTCYCDACRKAFKAKYGKDLEKATKNEQLNFTLDSYLAFQKKEIDPIIAELAPNAQRLMFTIPPIYKTGFEQFAPKIDKKTILVHWEYNPAKGHFKGLPERLTRYRKAGHTLWFMPTTDFSLVTGHEDAVPVQVDVCRKAGIRNFMYFMGPYWADRLEKTSWYLNKKQGAKTK